MSTPSISERLVPRIFNRYVAISVGSVLVVISVVRAYKKRKQLEQKRNSYPRDVVILHHLEPGFNAPSTSPYVLKLETWLRLADVKYQNEFAFEFGSKGKIPFITYNGEDVCDTDFIIQYLSKKLDKDLSKNFSLKDQGIARAFSKMNEESLMWVVALHRYVYKPDQSQTGLPWYLYKFIFTPVFKRRGKAQGYGLHSQEEVYSIGRKDLKSINDFLEGKKFLLGDRPCNEDSSLFGMICQILYHENGPMNKFVKSECPNIVSYIDRIKSTYWQDWDQRITNKSKTNA